jgi:hypothetical protein
MLSPADAQGAIGSAPYAIILSAMKVRAGTPFVPPYSFFFCTFAQAVLEAQGEI